MKLLTKTSVYYVVFSILVFITGGIIFYHFIKTIVYTKVSESLHTERVIIQEQIEHSNNIPDFTTVFGHQIEVILYNHKVAKSNVAKERIIDTLIYDTLANHMIPNRHLVYLDNDSKGRTYRISILRPTIYSETLTENIFLAMLVMFFSLSIILIPVNYFVSKKIWVPFYDTIKIISDFDVHTSQPIVFSRTNVLEFNQLNKVLTMMSEKIRKDFLNLKEFTEDVSHETQTPLAIIRSKLELLIQTKNLDDEKMELIQSAYEAATRLSRLNQSLSLLSKIENQQYQKKEAVSLALLISKFLSNHQEFIQKKKLTVIEKTDEHVLININPDLADILISNLISNAIRHNIPDGRIEINLVPGTLIIKNTGRQTEKEPIHYFRRFSKSGRSADSLGLGLSIVKKICTIYCINIEYTYQNDLHIIILDFTEINVNKC
ncbi:MAG: HAMP domain-containing sensor histidine kinase [Bacteroidia bacterium]|nr:HAMP domain-containing sensor histidine kinase [Bacteroidia bacterium]